MKFVYEYIGQKAGCCPLYKCTSSDGSMFPFHGAFGRGPPLSKGRQRESEEQQSSLAPKSDSVRKEESSSCGKVNCEQAPVMESKCRMLDPDDNTFPRPQGRHSTCCPMFRCENSDGSSFSFHGAFGRGPTTLSQKSMFEFKTTTPSPNDVCSEVHCQFPPFDSQCSIVDVLDTNVKRPKGKTAKCCNLFNCKNKDGSSFPFHGVYGKGPIKPPPTLEKQEENFSCKEVHCQFPPNDAKCTLHDKSDDSIQQPKGNKKSCCGGALYKCVNDDGSYFPFHGAFGRGPVKGSEKIKKTTTPTPPPSSSTAFPPRTTTPFSSMAMPFTFPTIDFGMNMFKENSKSSTLPQSIKSTTVAPITTTTPASLFKEPKMDFNFPMMAMDMNMGMSNFGASSKTTTPIPSSTFGRLSTTTPSSLSKEPEFPKMDFSFPMMSMDMGMGMSNFGASSKTTTPIPPSKFGVLSTPASVLIATPATKTTTSRPATTTQFSSMIKEMEFPKMDFPSMDFGMSGFGDSSSKSKTTTPSPFSTSIKKPDLTSTASPFPTMEMPSMDFNMMDMKMPSMDFPSMTSMTPSTNKTGENGNVNVMKVVDKTNGNVETNVVATGGEDAVAFATDGGGDTSDADIAAMQKEMDAMSASMNMNMMMKKKRETE
ncbi:uncharacterized protein LOC118434452 [Folsomia candida]|uniref:uncharacterized protein LOC118434452 n=1 Tax=Folsomia candida TaxID=158441 RepID=UPI00160515B3|nr:uncharacterized protein LOC118434452 [Folsomia candida]